MTQDRCNTMGIKAQEWGAVPTWTLMTFSKCSSVGAWEVWEVWEAWVAWAGWEEWEAWAEWEAVGSAREAETETPFHSNLDD